MATKDIIQQIKDTYLELTKRANEMGLIPYVPAVYARPKIIDEIGLEEVLRIGSAAGLVTWVPVIPDGRIESDDIFIVDLSWGEFDDEEE